MTSRPVNSVQNGALIPPWQALVGEELQKPYMQSLKAFLQGEKAAGKVIYPKGAEYFNALNHTPPDHVRVVILGQDPYHGAVNGMAQAHGLSFSVRRGVPPPPSLQNIFKELQTDLGLPIPNHGDLTSWADQGVLLLNAALSVEAGLAASHQNRGWEQFTDRIIQTLNAQKSGLVFMLWGAHAQKKAAMVDRKRHLILEAPHPSPLSAHRGFFGCRHFSKANTYLESAGATPIDWRL